MMWHSTFEDPFLCIGRAIPAASFIGAFRTTKTLFQFYKWEKREQTHLEITTTFRVPRNRDRKIWFGFWRSKMNGMRCVAWQSKNLMKTTLFGCGQKEMLRDFFKLTKGVFTNTRGKNLIIIREHNGETKMNKCISVWLKGFEGSKVIPD